MRAGYVEWTSPNILVKTFALTTTIKWDISDRSCVVTVTALKGRFTILQTEASAEEVLLSSFGHLPLTGNLTLLQSIQYIIQTIKLRMRNGRY